MFKVTTEIDNDKVAGLLCTAFEGGASYWAEVLDKKAPRRKPTFRGDWNEYTTYSYPLGTGGRVRIKDRESGKIYTLNRASILKGLQLMAEKAPNHFGDFVNENDDADTGDVFLQYALLGDLIYG